MGLLQLLKHCLGVQVAFTLATTESKPNSRRASSPAPLVIPPSQYLQVEGNDGPWSTFDLRVGTPPQHVRALVSTASPETLVVLSSLGCSSGAFRTAQGQATVPANCFSARGGLFQANASSSWLDQGTFAINHNGVGLEANLGYSQAADFGLDTLGVGLLSGSTGGPALPNQTVAGIATASPFYLGVFGLGTQPVNFTTLGNVSAPSYFASLKTQGYIPSLSWSYTAGAIYRLKQVYGQLIFGGYDASRFVQNGVSFSMADDVSRDLVVFLQSATYSGGSSGEPQTLLTEPISVFIDSTDPFLWLPADACEAFEQAFGLALDAQTGLYLVNSTHHASLLSSGAEVALQLSDVLQGGDTVTIVLPYEAFDLQVSSPLVTKETSYYFPLKRAANSTQYTLGRTFLQEAYLSVDYERGLFNVSQCSWVQGAAPTIIPVLSDSVRQDTPSPSASSGGQASTDRGSSGLSKAAVGGVAVGVIALVGFLAVGGWALVRRQQKKKAGPNPALGQGPASTQASATAGSFGPEKQLDGVAMDGAFELDDTHSKLSKPHSHTGTGGLSELDADARIYQMSDDDGTDSLAGARHGVPAPVYELATV